jgi:hypothetical protein
VMGSRWAEAGDAIRSARTSRRKGICTSYQT